MWLVKPVIQRHLLIYDVLYVVNRAMEGLAHMTSGLHDLRMKAEHLWNPSRVPVCKAVIKAMWAALKNKKYKTYSALFTI